MRVSLETLKDRAGWEKAGVRLPAFDVEQMRKKTEEAPIWVHFGAGNIFRAFIAVLQQRLLDEGLSDRGIIAADTFDVDNIRMIYGGYDNLTLSVTLNADATIDKEIVASVSEAVVAQPGERADYERLLQAFAAPSLQMISFTITEKGYALRQMDGSYLKVVEEDLANGPEKARHAMTIVTALLYHRYQNGKVPLAVVSMDNCSHNGEKLQNSILEVARAWQISGFVPKEFVRWLSDETQVSFPWSMIDKITPRPAPEVQRMLEETGIEAVAPLETPRGTFVAPFVNAEKAQYLVVEDKFPNGRPPLEKAGVYFTDRETVNKTERMKVTTCLNPLHTALAVYGCLLGYTLIREEMKDEDLVKLIRRLGYQEGLPCPIRLCRTRRSGLPRIPPRKSGSASGRRSKAISRKSAPWINWSPCRWQLPAGFGICWEWMTRGRPCPCPEIRCWMNCAACWPVLNWASRKAAGTNCSRFCPILLFSAAT